MKIPIPTAFFNPATRPTIDELRTIWRYTYAHAAMCEAVQYLDLLDQDAANKPENITFRRALMSAMVTAYVRPFTQSRMFSGKGGNFVGLGGVEPPPGLKVAHENIIRLRHQAVGHKDGSEKGGEINKMVLFREEGDLFHINTVTLDGLDAVTCAQLKMLCSHYVSHCGMQLAQVVPKYATEIRKLLKGTYEIVLSEPPAPWIIPAKGDGKAHSIPLA